MPALHNRERDTTDYRDQRQNQRQDDREISLGTGTILAIFFALALVCAVFFGLGYSMGRKSLQPPPIVADTSTPSSSNFTNFKPAAGNPTGQSFSSASAKTNPAPSISPPPADPDGEIVTSVRPSSEDAPVRPKQSPAARVVVPESPAPIVRQPAKTASAIPSSASPTAIPATSAAGTAMVQVAAVSHQEDADVLTAALKKRGYAVLIRQEPQDKLLHVQIGPFPTKKDAEAMRQRLLSDGYNAIVK